MLVLVDFLELEVVVAPELGVASSHGVGGFVSALTATTGVVFPGSLHPRRCPRRENDVR